MTTKKARPESVTEYINAAPKEAGKKLREMRACVRASAPGAKESGHIRRFQTSHRLLTHAVSQKSVGESLC